MSDDPEEMSPAGRDYAARVLLHFLETHDVPCPTCGYNLRRLTVLRCPECGKAVPLTVARELPWVRAAVVVMALACPAIGSPLAIALAIDAYYHGGPPVHNHAVQFVMGGSIVTLVPLAVAIAGFRRFRRLPERVQTVATGVALAWDLALLVVLGGLNMGLWH